jgi:hypothetical protein
MSRFKNCTVWTREFLLTVTISRSLVTCFIERANRRTRAVLARTRISIGQAKISILRTQKYCQLGMCECQEIQQHAVSNLTSHFVHCKPTKCSRQGHCPVFLLQTEEPPTVPAGWHTHSKGQKYLIDLKIILVESLH